MEMLYKDKKVEKLCTNLKEAKKEFGEQYAVRLFKSLSFIESAVSLKSVISYAPYYFHNLTGERKGQYAIAPAGRNKGLRVVIIPADRDGKHVLKSNIHEIAESTRIIVVVEVSNHYE